MSFLDRIHECNGWDPSHFLPWSIAGEPVGRLRLEFAERLRRFTDIFVIAPSGVRLAAHLDTQAARSLALDLAIRELVREGSINHLHGESYPVIADCRTRPLAVMDRAAAPYFGIRTFGQHLNGFVRDAGGLHMWIGRRSVQRRVFPGRLDHLVAGGLPRGISLQANLVKECWEEAAIPQDLAMQAQPVGTVTYIKETEKGLKPDTLYCYDLELPKDFVPRCTDGEVESFSLLPLEEVISLVRDTSEFKPNCNLVIIDFLVRHGCLDPEQEEYSAIVEGLHPPSRPQAETMTADFF